jgi:hypothetical protein
MAGYSPAMTAAGDPLSRALGEALAGRPQALHGLLARGSRLPGPRINEDLAEAFALACRGLGGKSDAVALSLARLSPDEAPGAGPLEFLPVCGLHALAARAADDPKVRATVVEELHARADDARFRVRDAVVRGLARIGAAAGDPLVRDVASWMDGYFHAAAVLRALGTDLWLTTLHEAGPVVERLDDAFALARDAPRSAARWPGHKALVEALGTEPGLVAVRFGVPVFDMLARWAAVKDPTLRSAVEQTLRFRKLAGRFGPEIERVNGALVASRAPKRNPDHDFGPSRDRSKNRRRSRR